MNFDRMKKHLIIVSVIAVIFAIVSLCVVVFGKRNVMIAGAEKSQVSAEQTSSTSEIMIEGNEFFGDGTFLEVKSGASVTMKDCTINGTESSQSAIVVHGKLILENSTITNYKSRSNSAIFVAGDGELLIRDSTLSNNSATNGGAIYGDENSIITIESGTFSENEATYGGLICSYGKLNINGGTFSRNKATEDGGVIYSCDTVDSLSKLDITGGTFAGNVSMIRGGVLSVAGYATVSGGTFVNNTATQEGGVFYVVSGSYYGEGSLDFQSGTISGNSSTTNAVSGGAIYCAGGFTYVTIGADAIIEQCVGTNGGAIYANGAQVAMKGSVTKCSASKFGGAIYASDSVNISGNLNENSAQYGGAIYSSSGFVTCSGASVLDNSAKNQGGAIYIANATKLEIDDTIISRNKANQSAGALFVSKVNSTIITGNSLIVGNKSLGGDGGAFLIYGGNTYLGTKNKQFTGCIAENSTTAYGGAISTSSSAYIYHNSGTIGAAKVIVDGEEKLFDGNKTLGSNGGGGVFLYNSYYYLQGGVINANSAIHGGGVYLYNGTITMTSGTISNNTAGGDGVDGSGGGIYVDYHAYNQAIIEDGVISNNTASGNGGGVFVETQSHVAGKVPLVVSGGEISGNNAIYGGGVYFKGANYNFTLAGTLSDNSATDGGAIYLNSANVTLSGTLDTNIASVNGGGAYVDELSTLNVARGTIKGNGTTIQAQNGGGIYAIGLANIENSSAISSNVVSSYGGGIYSTGKLNMTGGLIQSNKASVWGGGIYLTGETNFHDITGGTISLNTAQYGAGIYTIGTSVVIGSNCVVQSNSSSNSGGGIYLNRTTATISGTFSLNSASNNGGNVHVNGSSELNLDNGSIIGNATTIQAKYGAGIYSVGSVSITNESLISKNYSQINGGGIYSTGSLAIDSSTIDSNRALSNGGGLYFDNANIANSTISNNYTGNSGGGLSMSSGKTTLSNVIISGNSTSKNSTANGGGLFAQCSSTSSVEAVLENVEIIGNSAANGGGIYSNTAGVTFVISGEESSISQNSTSAQGGGVWIGSGVGFSMTGGKINGNKTTTANGSGGGVYFQSSIIDFSGVTISENTAKSAGGGLYATGVGSVDEPFVFGGNNTISKNITEANGGGIFIVGSYATIENNNFDGNTASVNGGGIEIRSGETILGEGVKISNNKATNGGGISIRSLTQMDEANMPVFTMNDGMISGNTASVSGGGIFTPAYHHIQVTINGGTIGRNTAGNAGGGINIEYSKLYLNGGLITQNKAVKNGGGVLASYTSAEMTGGNIERNGLVEAADDIEIHGGGFVTYKGFNGSGKEEDGFVMTGGVISQNYVKDVINQSSGEFMEMGAGLYISGNTYAVISGGDIYDNYFVNTTQGQGANIYVNHSATLILNAGEKDGVLTVVDNGTHQSAMLGGGIMNIGTTIINDCDINCNAQYGSDIFNAGALTVNGGKVCDIVSTLPFNIDFANLDSIGKIALGSNCNGTNCDDEVINSGGEVLYKYSSAYLNVTGESFSSSIESIELKLFDYVIDNETLEYTILDTYDNMDSHYFISWDESSEYYNNPAVKSIIRGEISNIDLSKFSIVTGENRYLYSYDDKLVITQLSTVEIDGNLILVLSGTEIVVAGETISINDEAYIARYGDNQTFEAWQLNEGGVLFNTSDSSFLYGQSIIPDGTYKIGDDVVINSKIKYLNTLTFYTEDYELLGYEKEISGSSYTCYTDVEDNGLYPEPIRLNFEIPKGAGYMTVTVNNQQYSNKTYSFQEPYYRSGYDELDMYIKKITIYVNDEVETIIEVDRTVVSNSGFSYDEGIVLDYGINYKVVIYYAY